MRWLLVLLGPITTLNQMSQVVDCSADAPQIERKAKHHNQYDDQRHVQAERGGIDYIWHLLHPFGDRHVMPHRPILIRHHTYRLPPQLEDACDPAFKR